MAQKAKKDRAKSNSSALNTLHIGSLSVNALFLLSHFLFRSRSLVAYGLFAAPSLICEYVLEISGRPKYDAATEYMFDVIWVTWASSILVILLGNWGWLLWISLPAYGVYLGSGLLGMGKQKMAEMQGAGDGATAPQGNRRARRAA
jgi:hypothetical protein